MKMDKLDTATIVGKKIVGIGAHPDDLEFGAGGTLIKLAQDNELTTIVATDGGMGTHEKDDKSKTSNTISDIRKTENREAARLMGVTRDIYWNYPDFSLKKYERNLRKKLLKLLLRERPDIIISFDPWGRYEPYVHPDHRCLGLLVVESVLAATLPLYIKKQGLSVPFLSPKPQIWLMAPAEPNIVVDVTKVWEKKWEALAVHKSQFDSEVSFENIKTRVSQIMGNIWTGENDVKFVEPFRVLEY